MHGVGGEVKRAIFGETGINCNHLCVFTFAKVEYDAWWAGTRVHQTYQKGDTSHPGWGVRERYKREKHKKDCGENRENLNELMLSEEIDVKFSL